MRMCLAVFGLLTLLSLLQMEQTQASYVWKYTGGTEILNTMFHLEHLLNIAIQKGVMTTKLL